MRITLRNNFHESSVRLNITIHNKDRNIVTLSRHQWERVKRELCGVTGCSCTLENETELTGNPDFPVIVYGNFAE